MLNFLLTALAIVLISSSCDDKKSKNERILFDSSGNINSISVVVSNEMWSGSVGEAIRGVLASPIYGLPQDNEPTFNINQIPTKVFSDFITRNRSILKIEMGKAPDFKVARNVYAKPQKVIVVSGNTKADIIELLNDNSDKILDEFKNEELKEKQRRIGKSLHHNKSIQEKLGLSIKFQTAYRIAKETDDFFWIRKDIQTGTTNIMVYELPFDAIKKNDSTVNQIIKIRDSIGKTYIPGPVEGSHMITENAYTPFHSEAILDNKPVLVTKGLWDLKGAFMSGPYINYAIEDKINNRWVVLEGFAFAPSVEKRNHVFELEAIIKSVKIN